MEFTQEQQEVLNKELKTKLEEYFKCYEIKLLNIKIHYNTTSSIADAYHMLYSAQYIVNGNDKNIESSLSELLTDGNKIYEILYPFIPKNVKIKEGFSILNDFQI